MSPNITIEKWTKDVKEWNSDLSDHQSHCMAEVVDGKKARCLVAGEIKTF